MIHIHWPSHVIIECSECGALNAVRTHKIDRLTLGVSKNATGWDLDGYACPVCVAAKVRACIVAEQPSVCAECGIDPTTCRACTEFVG